MKTLNIDIESFSKFDLTKQGLHKYKQDVEILLFAYCFDFMVDPVCVDMVALKDKPRSKQLPLGVYTALTDPTVKKIAFNAPFEIACIQEYFGIQLDPNQWECTMVRVAMAGLPFSLGQASKALEIETQKDASGSSLIQYFCVPVEPTAANNFRVRNWPQHDTEKWKRFISYCITDVKTEMAVGAKVNFLPRLDTEKRLWTLDLKINTFGVRVDQKFARNAIKMNRIFRDRLVTEAINISGVSNPNSRNQIKKWLEDEENITLDSLKKDYVKNLIKHVESDKSKRILRIRQLLSKTSINKYASMLHCLCDDGRVKGLLQFLGANRTGRWAARLTQLHNLPKSKIDDELLAIAREMVIDCDLEDMEMVFGAVPDILSQLIRTAFIPAPGKKYIVSDFSAIEARVISWLATEQWRLDIFNSHGKIYEATGARMFNVPLSHVTKGTPLYVPKYRDAAKVAELACGFQGNVNAFIRMCESQGIELPEEMFQPAVDDWRKANPNIVRLWKGMERAAVTAMTTGEKVFISDIIDSGYNGDGTPFVKVNRGVYFIKRNGYLLMGLPSGRMLAYYGAKLEDGKYGKKITYRGIDQDTKQWRSEDTYGGKLTENCLIGSTKVVTLRGIVPIVEILKTDYLWDGLNWVLSLGVIDKGFQNTISLNGLGVTPEHKILTEYGWKNASSCEGYRRTTVQLPDGYKVRSRRREKINVVSALRLRFGERDSSFGVKKIKNKIMRLYAKTANWCKTKITRNVRSTSICGLAFNVGSMQVTYASGLSQLWWAWDSCLRKMENVRRFLGRYGQKIFTVADFRQDRCERELRIAELPMGYFESSGTQQKTQSFNRNAVGFDNSSRSFRKIGRESDYVALSNKQQLEAGKFVCESGRYEQVYDIINSGPLHRFTVIDGDGFPLIVHNCVQAIARDCLANGLLNLDDAGYDIAFHVHDETISECDEDFGSLEEVNVLMVKPRPWMKDLPLKAEGFIGYYYKKEQ